MKYKVCSAVHPNKGIEVSYRKSLIRMIDAMCKSFEFWVKVIYNKYPPKIQELADHAFDELPPSKKAQKKIILLSESWAEKFDFVSARIAERYVGGVFNASQESLKRSLQGAGVEVKFKMTPVVRDALNASLQENVALIKSIPIQYHNKIQSIISRAYATGMKIEEVSEEIHDLYPVTKARASLIARDQCNKANSVLNRARLLEVGVERAIWMHSHMGKHPRPDHVASNGKMYDVAKGCLISGEYIQPGYLINCRCTARPVVPK